MICTRPEGKSEDVKLVITKAKSNVKKILNTLEGDKSPTEKTKSTPTDLCDLSEKIKSPCSSVKTETSSSISKQTLDTINYSQEVSLDISVTKPACE